MGNEAQLTWETCTGTGAEGTHCPTEDKMVVINKPKTHNWVIFVGQGQRSRMHFEGQRDV